MTNKPKYKIDDKVDFTVPDQYNDKKWRDCTGIITKIKPINNETFFVYEIDDNMPDISEEAIYGLSTNQSRHKYKPGDRVGYFADGNYCRGKVGWLRWDIDGDPVYRCESADHTNTTFFISEKNIDILVEG